ESLARTFFASPETHGSGTIVSDVEVTEMELLTDDVTGRPAWRISIDGTVTDAARAKWTSAFVLSVDAQTGDIRVVAQG
ncbi:MAG TPA: hypothetical protein VH371_01710, partial [Candidatus Limnocylindrales bacterium]